MAKTRIKIPDDLATKVMFASDRTCCVCREATRKCEIHHIDGDPSNNELSNLAVVCKDCQSEAHTNHAFARNLTPELVRIYNETWRVIVGARLSPGGEQALLIEYQQQTLLELSLAPHEWKNHYMVLYPGHFLDTESDSAGQFRDIWDRITAVAVHQYTVDEWKRYLALFETTVRRVASRLERILAAHHDVVSIKIKLAVLRTNSRLETERNVYLHFPQIVNSLEGNDGVFTARFSETAKVLASFSRLVDEERVALAPGT